MSGVCPPLALLQVPTLHTGVSSCPVPTDPDAHVAPLIRQRPDKAAGAWPSPRVCLITPLQHQSHAQGISMTPGTLMAETVCPSTGTESEILKAPKPYCLWLTRKKPLGSDCNAFLTGAQLHSWLLCQKKLVVDVGELILALSKGYFRPITQTCANHWSLCHM